MSITINWGDFNPQKKVNVKNITLANYKDLIGRKFFYNSEYFKNIPFNIIGLGYRPQSLDVQTWEGRRCVTNRLNGKTTGSHCAKDIIKMIKEGSLSLRRK